MKSNTAVANALKTGTAVKAVPELVIDWNMNRYVGVTADNTPSDVDEGLDVEIFPVESIAEPNRPGKGINKARIGHSIIGQEYDITGPRNGRFYVADRDDTYKYWTSPVKSDSLGVIFKVKPYVLYDSSVTVNKIVIGIENSWSSPSIFSIQTTTSSNPTETSWTEVANQNNVGTDWKATGRIVLYWTGSAWGTAGRSDNSDKSPKTTTIRGVRLVVNQLEGGYKITKNGSLVNSTYKKETGSGGYVEYQTDGKNTYFDLIEISARLEVNLTPYLISTSDDFDMGEASNLYPIGTTTTNQGSITLSNLYKDSGGNWITGLFSRDNSNSPYSKFIDANAEVNLKYNYYNVNTNALIGTVQGYKMYTESWTGQGSEQVSVDLSDYSKFFDVDDAKLRPAMWENLTVPQIVWRILDSIGFTDYEIMSDVERVTEHTIPVFYVDGEKTVWEVLDDLAQATQTAIYFDSYGKLQVRTRDFAFSSQDSAVWGFSSVKTDQLPSIVSLDINTEFEPNYFTVNYQKTDWSAERRGVAPMQTVWEPEDDSVVLRATPLMTTLDKTDTYFKISSDDVRFWPYSGMVNIQGELIRFDGKRYIYYTGTNGNTQNTMVINSDDEYKKRNEKTPLEYRHKNHFTGQLKITERGVWNSENKRHPVDAEGYSVHQLSGGTYTADVSGFYQDRQHSRVQLMSNFSADGALKLATRGATDDSPFYNYGTRMRFLKETGRTTQRAGIVFHNATNQEDGYYIEITPSSKIDGASERKEVSIIARSSGNSTILDTQRAAIGENIDYEIDVTWTNDSGTHRINVWINGKLVCSANKSSGTVASNGKFGMFVRGSTRAEFEYLYAIARIEESPLAEDFSFLNKIETGYMGGQWDREWVYRWKDYKRRIQKKSNNEGKRFNRMFFDEFGPIVHEIRKFNVKFDPSPVLSSKLYLTNDWSAVCLEYRANPFGADFYLANTSRHDAIINGDDSISFSGTGESIPQVLNVYGRVLITNEETETVVAQNAAQIRKRGKIESELSSQWIQSKQMAKDISNWMNNNFSYGNDHLTVEVFGNPLIELSDIVTIWHPDAYIAADYFVIGIKNEFETGLTTTLELRRRRTA